MEFYLSLFAPYVSWHLNVIVAFSVISNSCHAKMLLIFFGKWGKFRIELLSIVL